jgi:hypothetical protein
MVECKWIEEIKQNCFKLIRQDTGEQIDTRPMSGGDRQVGLGFDGDGDDEGEISFVDQAELLETADTEPPLAAAPAKPARKRTTTPPAAKSKAKAKPVKTKPKPKGHTRHAHA